MSFFSFWRHPLNSPERYAQAAPRKADSTGTGLAAPILKAALLLRVSGFTKWQSRKIHFFARIGFDQKNSQIDFLHALLHSDAGAEPR